MENYSYYICCRGNAHFDIRKLKESTFENLHLDEMGFDVPEETKPTTLKEEVVELILKRPKLMDQSEGLPIHLKGEIKERRDKYFMTMDSLFGWINGWEIFGYFDHEFCRSMIDINENMIIFSTTELDINIHQDWQGLYEAPDTQSDKVKKGTDIWNKGGAIGFYLEDAYNNLIRKFYLHFPGPGGKVTVSYRVLEHDNNEYVERMMNMVNLELYLQRPESPACIVQ